MKKAIKHPGMPGTHKEGKKVETSHPHKQNGRDVKPEGMKNAKTGGSKKGR